MIWLIILNPEIQEVQYQLQGIHSNWINAENRNYASFAKVGGGNYTFKIRSRTIGGEWGTENKIKIKIDPPFWDTWWFYILAFLSALFVVFFFYSYRVKKIKEQEELKSQFQLQLAEVEMKALRAQMNPHFLFNCLNSIKLFIVENDIKSASTYLTKFAKLIRLILQNSKNKFVTLADEMEALKLYIEMEKMRFSNQFEFSIQIDPTLNIASIEIPPLIIQPYVENAIWHGLTRADRPNRLTISISQIDNKLQCIIEDNGIGREASFKSNNHRRNKKLSMGMEITENRLSLTNELFNMKTVVNIEDLKNQDGTAAGTRVVLTVPFTG
ncbi:MAG: histidine kinase [Saprospiraceae bacterium]